MPSLRANGVELDYDVHGPADGRPLLLIMGLAMQRVAWPPALLDALAARGFRCISFDNRDIGLSTRFEAHGSPSLPQVVASRLIGRRYRLPYTLADMADDGAALLEALGVPAADVVGISMGGMIAQHFASRHPQRARSITLMATSSGRLGLPLPRPSVLRVMLTRPQSGQGLDAAVDYVTRLFRLIGSPAYPMSRNELQRRARAAVERAPLGSGVNRQVAAIISDIERPDLLRRITTPALVLHGIADPLVPLAHGIDLARALPRAKLQTFPGWGHDLPDALARDFATVIASHAAQAGG